MCALIGCDWVTHVLIGCLLPRLLDVPSLVRSFPYEFGLLLGSQTMIVVEKLAHVWIQMVGANDDIKCNPNVYAALYSLIFTFFSRLNFLINGQTSPPEPHS